MPVTTTAINGVLPTHSKAVQALATNVSTSKPTAVVKEENEETPQAQAMDLSTVAQSRVPQLTGQTMQLSNKVCGTIQGPQNVTITSGELQQLNNLPKTVTANTIKVPQIPVAKNNNDSSTTLNISVEAGEDATTKINS